MLEIGKWSVYVSNGKMPKDGVFVLQITDDVLDEENWPLSVIVIQNGKVVHQYHLYHSTKRHAYTMPNMVSWTHIRVAEWTQFESVSRHPQITYNILRVH